MNKGLKHRFSELLMLIGCISFFGGGLGVSFFQLDVKMSLILGIGGFIVFLIGVELYLHTRETPY